MDRGPVPEVKSFLICREVFQDVISGEYIVVGPLVNVVAPHFPWTAPLCFLAELTSSHGSYTPTLQLHDLEGNVVWGQELQPPLQAADPLKFHLVSFRQMGVRIPAPGKYDVVLLLNGREVARHVLLAALARPGVA
jgi:hypothetical protein